MSLDHLVYATPDLPATVADLEGSLGVRAAPGGRHPGFGTRNHLIGLGGRSYLEIIGPDPEQDPPPDPRPFGIDELTGAALVSWAVAVEDIDAAVARARAQGYDPGDARDMSRHTPAGDLLSWRLTRPQGLVPFLIDWGATRHPAESGLPAAGLVSLTIGHPDPGALTKDLAAVGVFTDVVPSPRPHLTAVLSGRHGEVTI
ncbi:Glyoxalase-like domain-containing protein [Nonomuraea solani]|uniref:Glyoxalase-like domain-containing protein n=1 Tax=Nonomuraea solani TaxID=1144553 RepID=A0A1H6E6S9_9ACTN|nr:VOC family protein [Nonomuraea solani]SEG93347.1 Glyoxalase-like domain-containing protein [Nonomuraea solani]